MGGWELTWRAQPTGLPWVLGLELCKKKTKTPGPRNYKYGESYFPSIENDARNVLLGITVETSFCSVHETFEVLFRQ